MADDSLFSGGSAVDLFKRMAGETRWHSFENTTGAKGAGGMTNSGAKGDAFARFPAGHTHTLMNVSGAGRVTRIWMTLRDRSPYMLRALVLRMYWDGADKPAVDVPLGDFFGLGGQMTAFESELFASPEGRSFVSYVPMPFATGARVTLTNESARDVELLFYDIDWLALKQPEPDAMYFHAAWRRERATALAQDFLILPTVRGAGRFLGASVVVNPSPVYARQWWGEGEVKVFLDGDGEHPTLCGTGTEDYIGTGWGQKQYAGRFAGCLMADWDVRRFSYYRLHVPDPVLFSSDIRVQVQVIGGADAEEVRGIMDAGAPLVPVTVHDEAGVGFQLLYQQTGVPFPRKGWVNYYRQDDYAAVAWFYLHAPVSDVPPLAPLAERAFGLSSKPSA